jgi:hypothetical protein
MSNGDLGTNSPSHNVITAYDKPNEAGFRRMKRKNWAQEVLAIRGEWSQTIYHQGNVAFSLRATADGRFWALYTRGFGRKIEAVAEAVCEASAEEMAAVMMQAVKDADGPYVDLIDEYGDLDPERFRAFQKSARVASQMRKQAMQADKHEAARPPL